MRGPGSKLTSGDVVDLDLGIPTGREAGFPRPAVIVTAQAVLDQAPTVVQVVPLTSSLRGLGSEVTLDPGAKGLDRPSAAQCQHVRAVSTGRIATVLGNGGPVDLLRIRETVALLLDLP
jgi:mRNA interferase MazF